MFLTTWSQHPEPIEHWKPLARRPHPGVPIRRGRAGTGHRAHISASGIRPGPRLAPVTARQRRLPVSGAVHDSLARDAGSNSRAATGVPRQAFRDRRSATGVPRQAFRDRRSATGVPRQAFRDRRSATGVNAASQSRSMWRWHGREVRHQGMVGRCAIGNAGAQSASELSATSGLLATSLDASRSEPAMVLLSGVEPPTY